MPNGRLENWKTVMASEEGDLLTKEGHPKEELRKLPKTILLKIAIDLDPDTVAESYQEGWTRDDILRVIERHVKGALGNQSIEGWPYIGDVDIFDSEVEEE